jgi:NTP pyrophosphatase (non-canonical NTP hydrolase)
MTETQAFNLANIELARAESLHDWNNVSLDQATLNLIEEAGEFVQAVNNYREGKGTKEQIQIELTQLMAMCLRTFKTQF